MKTKFVPHVEIEPLECGHWVMLEKPREVTEGVINFVRRHVVQAGPRAKL